MAKKRGLKHTWLAKIPIIRNWLVADLIGGKDVRIWGFGGVNWILTLGGFSIFIPYAGLILYPIYLAYYFCCYNQLYQIYMTLSWTVKQSFP